MNVTDNINATPAHDAAEYGKIKTMLLLLKNGADISITDTVSNQGKTRVVFLEVYLGTQVV